MTSSPWFPSPLLKPKSRSFRIGSLPVPERQRETQPLLEVGEAREPVLAPVVRARSRLVVGEVLPRVAVRAVVLADGAPLPLAEIRPPLPPRRVPLASASPAACAPRTCLSVRPGRRHPWAVTLLLGRRVGPPAGRGEVVRASGTPGARLVFVDRRVRREHRIDDAPGLFDVVHPREQRRVALEGVGEDALVRGALVGGRLPARHQLGALADHLVGVVHRRDAERDRQARVDAEAEVVRQRRGSGEDARRLVAGG